MELADKTVNMMFKYLFLIKPEAEVLIFNYSIFVP